MTHDDMKAGEESILNSKPIEPMKKRKAKATVNGNGRLIEPPRVYTADELLALEAPPQAMLIDTVLPTPGAVLMVGAHKSGKTVLAAQMAISIATGRAVMDNYSVVNGRRPVLVVEQDDSAGDVSWRDYLKLSPATAAGIPLFLFTRIAYRFGLDFNTWLENEITSHSAACVILDSYTALRPHRKPGGDIVKTESEELAALDELAKRNHCTIIVITHVSKGSNSMDWSDQTAGSYAQGAAVESQIHIARFKNLAGEAGERLMQGRGRHIRDFEAVIRFRIGTLDYAHVLDGPAASSYVELKELHRVFADREFTPKDVYQETGMARTTAFRLFDKLWSAGALDRPNYGNYRISAAIRKCL